MREVTVVMRPPCEHRVLNARPMNGARVLRPLVGAAQCWDRRPPPVAHGTADWVGPRGDAAAGNSLARWRFPAFWRAWNACASCADDFLYHILFFNVNAAGYCRFHFQLNQGAAITAPRIRIQSTYGGFFTPVILTSPGDFTLAEKWWDVKLVINNTASTVETFLDGVSKGVGDFSTRPDFATGGKFGFGQYIDDPVVLDRTVYVDAYTVISNADVADWSAYE